MYNKSKCQSRIRRVCELKNHLISIKIIVAGQHAFSWSVTLIRNGVEKRLEFPGGRIPALKEYQRLQTQFRQVGDCSLAI